MPKQDYSKPSNFGGLAAQSILPRTDDVAVDPSTGHIYLIHVNDCVVTRIHAQTKKWELVAGIMGVMGFDNGKALSSTFFAPVKIAWYDGILYVLDLGAKCVRSVDFANDLTDVAAGLCFDPASDASDTTKFKSPLKMAVGQTGIVIVGMLLIFVLH